MTVIHAKTAKNDTSHFKYLYNEALINFNLNHLTPRLPPSEFKVLAASKILLDRIMDTLNNQVLKPHPLQQVCHCGWLSKWVYGPTVPAINNDTVLYSIKVSYELKSCRPHPTCNSVIITTIKLLSFTNIMLNSEKVYTSTKAWKLETGLEDESTMVLKIVGNYQSSWSNIKKELVSSAPIQFILSNSYP